MAFVKGKATPGAGRKKKVDELKIRNIAVESITEKYGSLKDGFLALLNSKESVLVKFVFEHAAGKPREKVDVDMNQEVEHIQVIQLPYNNRPTVEQAN